MTDYTITIDGRTYDLSRKSDRARFTQVETDLSIAAQIKAMRLIRGWSQRELARRAGLRQTQISQLENPISLNCSMATLERIAFAFDVGLIARFDPWSSVIGVDPPALVVADYEHDPGLATA